MVEQRRLDQLFGALSDPTRRALLGRMATGEQRVTELAERFPVSLAAISKHLRVLERAGLVRRRIVGRDHHLSLRSEALTDATEWLNYHQRFWTRSLDALAELVEVGTSTPRRAGHASRSGRRRRGAR